MIGSFGFNFGIIHHFFARNNNWGFKSVEVPSLEQSQIQTNVCMTNGIVLIGFVEKSCEVFDVVHILYIMIFKKFFFWLDPKETKSQGHESSAVKLNLEF